MPLEADEGRDMNAWMLRPRHWDFGKLSVPLQRMRQVRWGSENIHGREACTGLDAFPEEASQSDVSGP
jgi:hypothetical protein